MLKKILFPVLILTIIYLIFVEYKDIFYVKSVFFRWLPLFLIFILIPILINLSLKQLEVNNRVFYSFSSILILDPLTGFIAGKIADKDIDLDGKMTKGIVIHKEWVKPKSQSGYWNLSCKFMTQNKVYITFRHTDRKNIYQIGDSLSIKYSESNPENSTILELK